MVDNEQLAAELVRLRAEHKRVCDFIRELVTQDCCRLCSDAENWIASHLAEHEGVTFMPRMPKEGTLERVFLDGLIAADRRDEGVTILDFVGTGITEENIDQIAQNLRNGMYESEGDAYLGLDA